MIEYFRPEFWRTAFKDDLVKLALLVDAVPIFLALFAGWGSEELVLLYWAENVIIGLASIARLVWSGSIKAGRIGFALGIGLAAFFTVHYGMFCFVHGVFVFTFAETVRFEPLETGEFIGPLALPAMVETIRGAFPGMTLALGLASLYQLVALLRDYWLTKAHSFPDITEEMTAPYGRIVVLHIAIFAGAFAMAALGDPMVGVLGLITLRMGFSVIGRVWRNRKMSATRPLS